MDILEYQDEVAWKRLALFFTVLHRTRTERGGKDQERRLTSTWGGSFFFKKGFIFF